MIQSQVARYAKFRMWDPIPEDYINMDYDVDFLANDFRAKYICAFAPYIPSKNK